MTDLRELLGDRYQATIQAALLADNPGLIEDAKRIGGQLGQLMYLANVDRMHRTLTAVLPDLLARAWNQGLWAEQRRHEPCLLHDVPAELSGIMSLWTGCVSGALRDERYLTELAAAGFADASVEVTRAYTCADVVALTGSLDDADLPAGTTRADVVDALAGAFAAAFVRAAKPA